MEKSAARVSAQFRKSVQGMLDLVTKQPGAVTSVVTSFEEFYQITFRKKLYADINELQKDLDEWIKYYNNERTHQGKMCCGRTPMATLLDGKTIWAEKNLAQI